MRAVNLDSTCEERFGFQAKGSFNCRYKNEPALVAAVIAATAVLWYVAYRFIAAPQRHPSLYIMAFALVSVVFWCIGVGAVRVALGGKKFLYEADDKEFHIYKEKDGNKILIETFYYIDVVEVSYKKIAPNRGFMVTVSTKYRKYRYPYLFRGARSTRDAEHCPFNILERRKGTANPDAAK